LSLGVVNSVRRWWRIGRRIVSVRPDGNVRAERAD